MDRPPRKQEERERTGIKSLRVGFNKVFGYYIEVTRANLSLVPDDYETETDPCQRRTVRDAGTQRDGGEDPRRRGADDRPRVPALYGAPRPKWPKKPRACSAWPTSSPSSTCTSPWPTSPSTAIMFDPWSMKATSSRSRAGRHAVVEAMLEEGAFVPNDLRLDQETQVILLTGPNMAGKSTYLRQAALTVLMAQIGSFVPAAEARIGVVDRIFTRVGASDDLATGQSTFMVEMNEVANILNHATVEKPGYPRRGRAGDKHL